MVKDKDGKPVLNAYGDPQLDDSWTNNQPGVHEVDAGDAREADKFNSMRFPARGC
jgi:hypothetical protein